MFHFVCVAVSQGIEVALTAEGRKVMVSALVIVVLLLVNILKP